MDEEPKTFEGDVATLLKVGNRVLKGIGTTHPLYASFTEALANVEEWNQNDDPQQNGWVDSQGRP